MSALQLFHLAFPVDSLEQARAFYGNCLPDDRHAGRNLG